MKKELRWSVYTKRLDQFITSRNLKLYIWPLVIGFFILTLFLFVGSPLSLFLLFFLGIFACVHFIILFLVMHIYQEWEYVINKEGIFRLSSGTGFFGKFSREHPFTQFMIKHHKSAFARVYLLNPFYLYIPFKYISHYETIGNRIIITPRCPLFCEFVIISKNNIDEIVSVLDKHIKKND